MVKFAEVEKDAFASFVETHPRKDSLRTEQPAIFPASTYIVDGDAIGQHPLHFAVAYTQYDNGKTRYFVEKTERQALIDKIARAIDPRIWDISEHLAAKSGITIDDYVNSLACYPSLKVSLQHAEAALSVLEADGLLGPVTA